jgi:hypothetical protein
VPEKHVPKARVGFDRTQIAGGEDTIEVIGVEAEHTQFVHSGLIIRQQCDFYATCMAVVEQRLYPRFGFVVACYDTYHSGKITFVIPLVGKLPCHGLSGCVCRVKRQAASQ